MVLTTMNENNSISTQQHNFGLPKDSQMNKWGKLDEVNMLKLQDAGMGKRLVAMIDGMKDNDLSGGEHLQDYAQYAVTYIASEFIINEEKYNAILAELTGLPINNDLKEAITSAIRKEIEANKDKARFTHRKAIDAKENASKIDALKALL